MFLRGVCAEGLPHPYGERVSASHLRVATGVVSHFDVTCS